MRFFWRLRFRTSQPHLCSWRRFLLNRLSCTMSQSLTLSPMVTTGISIIFTAHQYLMHLVMSNLLFFSSSESTFGKLSYLQPMDTRQYLYCLKPKPEYAEKAGVIKGVTVIGKLDIVWKTNLGERGRLQTSQLQRMVFQNLTMKILCVNLPLLQTEIYLIKLDLLYYRPQDMEI